MTQLAVNIAAMAPTVAPIAARLADDLTVDLHQDDEMAVAAALAHAVSAGFAEGARAITLQLRLEGWPVTLELVRDEIADAWADT